MGIKFRLLMLVVFSISAEVTLTHVPCKVKMVKKGCYEDIGAIKKDPNIRPLDNLLQNFRSSVNWGEGWNNFLHETICKCADLAKAKGHHYIGVQSFGECWSGDPSEDLFTYPAKSSGKCWGYKPNYLECDDTAETECIGTGNHNYIYELILSGSPCSFSPCYHGGNCTDDGNSFLCTCPCGYKGKRCEEKVLPCASAPCLNGGNCTNLEKSSFLCTCPCGYKGNRCQHKVSPCSSSPCFNGGACINDGDKAFKCRCPTGYEGKRCQKNELSCDSAPCKNGGKCKNVALPEMWDKLMARMHN